MSPRSATIVGAGLIMLLPWWMVIRMGGRLRQSSPAYFMVAGAIVSFIVVCMGSAALLRHANTSFIYGFGLVAGGRGFPLADKIRRNLRSILIPLESWSKYGNKAMT